MRIYDYFPLPLTLPRYGFIRYIVTRQRAPPRFAPTMQPRWAR